MADELGPRAPGEDPRRRPFDSSADLPAADEAGGPPKPRLFNWFRRLAKLWGFALFCVLVIYIFRDVALPFVFAVLVAYILAPLVDRMARLRVAGRPFPRGLAVILLYINVLAILGLFIGYFIPKLSGDIARVFREAPELFEKLNHEYLPKVTAWVDDKLGAGVQSRPAAPPLPKPSLERPAGTGVVVEPLADGRYRIDLSGVNLEVRPAEGGGFLVVPPQLDEPDSNGEGRWERSIKQ